MNKVLESLQTKENHLCPKVFLEETEEGKKNHRYLKCAEPCFMFTAVKGTSQFSGSLPEDSVQTAYMKEELTINRSDLSTEVSF